jgi:glycosyltransferase involved in cell wall biosynthesis
MRICLATYQAVMMLKGGPRTQILQTKEELERLGVEVSLFDGWEEFRSDRFDLVHIFSANLGTYHLARALKLQGVPFVVSPIFYTRRSPFAVRSVVAVDRIVRKVLHGVWSDYGLIAEICRWAKGVLPNTEAEAGIFRGSLGVPADNIEVVPNGVESRFRQAQPDAFKRSYGLENFILNVGHIGPARKNVLHLIEALEGIDRKAVIIGRIEESDAGRSCLEQAKKNPNLLVLDSLDHGSDLLASAYAACDVFVLPSQFETPGIAALEAALAGARIVITPHGGTGEYFGREAEYVDPTSVASIRAGIERSIARPKNNALRDRIEKEFLWEHVARRTLRVYEKILAKV